MMRKTLFMAAAGAAAAWLAATAAESNAIALDTRTLAAGDCGPAAVDARGFTVDLSDDILLNTKIPLGTVILLR
jgi:hypothetical protein